MAKKEDKQKKKMKMKRTNGNTSTNNEEEVKNNEEKSVIRDSRFSSLHWDPRFQRLPKHQSKVSLDSRFQSLFTDKRFSSSFAPLDKRGRPKSLNSLNPLRHYYRQEEPPPPSQDPLDEKNQPAALESSESESSSSSSSDDDEDNVVGEEGSDATMSTTSSSSSDDDDAIYSDEDVPSEKEDIPTIERETHRLAIVNMDWNFVKAVDLYVALSSDLPKGGEILSITVYPSKFGLKRMEEEAVHGPVALFDNEREYSEDDDEDDEIDNDKLRSYEMSKLRYYYAVVVCDSSTTADHLYQNFNGIEFERTSNKFDLRFIPDSMEFKHPPRDIATEMPTTYQPVDFSTRALQQSKIHLTWDADEPNRKKIMKRKFKPDQLDELEFKEFLASDDEDTDDNDDENGEADTLNNESKRSNKRDKYRALIESGNGSDADDDSKGDMEVTFNTGLEDLSDRILKKQDKKSETVWEAHLRKRSEKKKARKNASKRLSSEDDDSDYDLEAAAHPDDFFVEEALDDDVEAKKISKKESSKKTKDKKNKREKLVHAEAENEQVASKEELELLLADDKGAECSLKGYNLKSKKTKGKKGKEILSEDKLPTPDFDDQRFAPLFKSPLFALDPTDPQFKRSASYLRQLAQKQQRERGKDAKGNDSIPQPEPDQLPSDDSLLKKQKISKSDNVSSQKDKLELSSLVRSVKRKVGTLKS